MSEERPQYRDMFDDGIRRAQTIAARLAERGDAPVTAAMLGGIMQCWVDYLGLARPGLTNDFFAAVRAAKEASARRAAPLVAPIDDGKCPF